MPKVCFWSAVDGTYHDIARGMLRSFNKVMNLDFHVFSPERVPGCIHHHIDSIGHKRGCMFKLELLRDVSALDYDIMIWLDVDTYFVRPFQNSFLDLTSQYPLFALLEDDLADPEFCFRNGGIDCKLAAEIRDHFRIPAFRHVNGGLFAIRRDQMSKVITLLRDVPRIFPAHIPPRDEHYLALASQILNASPPSLYDHLDQYALDVAGCPWPGERYGVTFGLGRRLPDGRPWHARKWSKQVKMLVDPAVVHVMNSKDALRRFGRSEELSARRVIGGGQPAV